MKSVLLLGYFGFGNVGDELLLKQFVLWMGKYFPQVALQVWGEPSDWTADLKAQWLPRKKPLAALQAFVKSDTVIFPGGGLWQDHSGRGLTAGFYYGWGKMAEVFGKNLIFFNQGIDGLKQSHLESRILDLFSRAKIAFLRETSQPSALLKKNKETAMMPDAFWAGTLKRVVKRDDELGVCISSSLPEADLKNLLGYLQNQKEFRKIVLFNFFPAADSNIVETARAVLDTFHQVTVVQGPEVLERMARCQKILGTRYHSLVLAQLLGIPFLGIFSELKSQRLAEQLQLPYLTAGQLSHKVPAFFTQWLQPSQNGLPAIEDLSSRAVVAWEKLRHVLQTL